MKPLSRLDKYKWVVGDCWRWLGFCRNGRPIVHYQGKKETVTRVIMHLLYGFDLDSKAYILHKQGCKYADCWNPDHLYIGNHAQNMQDRMESRTHCRHGHELTQGNTYNYPDGRTECRICRKEQVRQFASRQKD